MKSLLVLLSVLVSAGQVYAAGSRQGGSTQYVTPGSRQDDALITISGAALNHLVIRRAETNRVSVSALVHWDNASAKIGGYGFANAMSVIEVGDRRSRDRWGGRSHRSDYENNFEVTSIPKDPRAPCRLFDGRGHVDGVCTQIIVTIPSYANYEIYENTTQVIDQPENKISLVVYDLNRPLPPPLPPAPNPFPSDRCDSTTQQDLDYLREVLRDIRTFESEKARLVDDFMNRKCFGGFRN
ncbi:MAG: hypothetical protein KDD25_09505 [Bdellovibrionales bacterium]|nr:hypothetical protein [Bdellovibrionales bacterium]